MTSPISNIQGCSIAVFIDCWQPSYENTQHDTDFRIKTFENILTVTEQIENLSGVILATYDTTEYQELTNNLYYQNTRTLFVNQQSVKYVTTHYLASLHDKDFAKVPAESTYSNILNHRWNCSQWAMSQDWQLEYYIKHLVPEVENIFVFGLHWNMCLHHRPIGIVNLRKLIQNQHLSSNTKLITHQDCIVGFSHTGDCAVNLAEAGFKDLSNGFYQIYPET